MNDRSEKMLEGVHPKLAALVRYAAGFLAFEVNEGLRDPVRQAALVAAGKSTTTRSRHLPSPVDGLARAVDLVPYSKATGRLTFDWCPEYHLLAITVKACAARIGVPVEWGGDWSTFKDGPHFQLPWKLYP